MIAESQESPNNLCASCGAISFNDKRCQECKNTHFISHPEINSLSILHIDCDAFYAAVEKFDNPKLQSKPIIIGGGRRGVVATCCYVARSFGVRSAMPMYKALKLCPQAEVISPNMARYREVSLQLRDYMLALSPLVEPISIDEAFIDMTGTEKLHGKTAAQCAIKFARDVEKSIGISVSIGLSYNKFLAKIASDLDKPRGFSVIGRAEAKDFLSDQPVSLIWGVGAAFQETLRRDGITKIKHLLNYSEAALAKKYGAIGSRLWHLASGNDTRPVKVTRPTKSISSETTFDYDKSDADELENILWGLCENTSAQLKKKNLAANSVNIKLKPNRHRVITRAARLSTPTQLAHQIFDYAAPLLRELCNGTPYRLLGVSASDLYEYQGEADSSLADPNLKQKNQTERAIDSLRDKYGPKIIGKGRQFKKR